LYAFIRRQGSSPYEAEDLTQEFSCCFLERDTLASAQPAAGKFRSLLLACLKNFLAKRARAIHRLRQRFGALLREQVAQTVSSEAEVEEQLRYLISVLGS
jgi:RNA polymerase sigma-70 factor (ECF subfamily)